MGELQIDAMNTLYGRLCEGMEQQRRQLLQAQQKVASYESRITTLQSECAQLRVACTEKEAEYQASAETLSVLRAQHDDITSRNQAITDNENRDAAQRERRREEYVLQEYRRNERAFSNFQQVEGMRGSMRYSVIDELMQFIGELEEGIELLASAPDAQSMLALGHKQRIFSCVVNVGSELRTRLLGERATAA